VPPIARATFVAHARNWVTSMKPNGSGHSQSAAAHSHHGACCAQARRQGRHDCLASSTINNMMGTETMPLTIAL